MAMRPLHHVPREDPDLPRGDLILHSSRRPESTPAGVRETAVGRGGKGRGKPQMAVVNCSRRGQFGATLMATTPPLFFFLDRGTGSRFILLALQAIAGGGGQGEQK